MKPAPTHGENAMCHPLNSRLCFVYASVIGWLLVLFDASPRDTATRQPPQ
jgi:hypothetical protein